MSSRLLLRVLQKQGVGVRGKGGGAVAAAAAGGGGERAVQSSGQEQSKGRPCFAAARAYTHSRSRLLLRLREGRHFTSFGHSAASAFSTDDSLEQAAPAAVEDSPPNAKRAEELLLEMGEAEGEEGKDFTQALRLLKEVEEGGQPLTLLLLNACLEVCARGREGEAAEQLLLDTRLSPGVDAYNRVLCAYAEGPQPEKALQLLSRMREEGGVKPDGNSYSVVFVGACAKRKGSAPKMFSAILELMKEDATRLGKEGMELGFEAAIASRCKKTDRGAGRLVLKDMQDSGFTPDERHYRMALRSCAAVGDVVGCRQLLKEQREGGIPPDDTSYLWALRACQKGGEEACLELLHEMEDMMGVQPSSGTYDAAIQCLAEAGKKDEAVRLMGDMQERHNLTPQLSTYLTLLRACAKVVDHQHAVQLLRQVSGLEGAELKEEHYVPVLQACAAAKDLGQLQALFGEMAADGHEAVNPPGMSKAPSPGPKAYACVLEAHRAAGAWSECAALFRGMHHKHGVTPTKRHYVAAVGACLDSGEEQQARQLLREMRESGVNMSHTLSKSLLQLSEECGALRLADDLYSEGLEEGLYRSHWSRTSQGGVEGGRFVDLRGYGGGLIIRTVLRHVVHKEGVFRGDKSEGAEDKSKGSDEDKSNKNKKGKKDSKLTSVVIKTVPTRAREGGGAPQRDSTEVKDGAKAVLACAEGLGVRMRKLEGGRNAIRMTPLHLEESIEKNI